MTIRLRVLGPVELTGADGEPAPLGGRRQERLAALLCAAAGRIMPSDRLVRLLWPDEGPRDPAAALHSQVWRLRRTLAAAGLGLERRGPGYVLLAEPADLDASAFEALVTGHRVEDCEPAAVRDLLAAGLALWRGEAYLGMSDIPALREEARRLSDLKLSWVERAAARLLEAGDTATASAYLRRTVAEDPLREQSRILLMRALAVEGRAADAVAQYHSYRRAQVDETGLDPGPAMANAYERLIAQETGNAAERPSPARVMPVAIPEPVSPIVGRESEADQLIRMLGGGHRLVTLTGPGGVGKTRLAVEVARRKWDADAVFVDLSRVRAAADVPDVFARAYGVGRAGPDPAAALAAAVGPGELLLVVDCPGQAMPAHEFLVDLLSRCPGAVAMVTSRERLGVPGEIEFPVRPLPAPDADADPEEAAAAAAVTLFLERVPHPFLAAWPDGPALVSRVGRLCRDLGGLPLAIETAAALAAHQPIDEVANRLVGSLREPVAAHDVAGPLDASIGWSYERLRPGERRVLLRLCAFSGRFGVPAVRAVCAGAGSETAVERLTALGLLTAHRDGPEVRYSVPAMISAYLERDHRHGDERTRAQAAHFHYHAGRCRAPQFLDDELLARIDSGYPDFLAALRHGMDRPGDDAVVGDLAISMVLYWLWREEPEPALTWLDRLADRLAGSPPWPARADVLRATFLRNLGRLDEAADMAVRGTAALAVAGDQDWLVTAYALLTGLADDRGDAEETVRCAEAAVRAARADVPRRLPEALGYLAYAHVAAGRPARAAEVALEALTMLDGVDSLALRAGTRINAAQALIEAGQGVVAVEVLTSGLGELRDVPDGMLGYRLKLGWAHLAAGHHAAALRWFATFADEVARTDQRLWVAEAIAGCACALVRGGPGRTAALVLGSAQRQLQRCEAGVSPWIRRQLDDAYGEITRRPDGSDLVRAGELLTVDAVIRMLPASRSTGVVAGRTTV
ncbi:MAG: BTAD domain-containing putative transcriptional regulator [Actinomycetota bacterium]|nr:BTAD domain-containing putative transcriptional regulator [Actinomycetota bacterium]